MSCVSLLFILDIVCLFSHTSSKPWISPVFILQSLLSTCSFSFQEAMMRKGLTSGRTASPSLCCFSSAVFKAFLFSIQIRFADCPERGKTHFTHLTDLAFDPLISTKLQKDRLKCSTVLPSRIFQGQCGSPFVRHSTVRVLGKITCI